MSTVMQLPNFTIGTKTSSKYHHTLRFFRMINVRYDRQDNGGFFNYCVTLTFYDI